MRYINIYNAQIDSSYINIDKPKGDSYSLTTTKKIFLRDLYKVKADTSIKVNLKATKTR